MYELELAFMVLAHSQRDPGEYHAELQTFAANPDGAPMLCCKGQSIIAINKSHFWQGLCGATQLTCTCTASPLRCAIFWMPVTSTSMLRSAWHTTRYIRLT